MARRGEPDQGQAVQPSCTSARRRVARLASSRRCSLPLSIRGKVDAIGLGFLEATKAYHVVEIKSMNASGWRAVQKHGLRAAKPEHWHQLHIGMAALGIARGVYIVANRDTEELLVERIHLDVEEANRQETRVERLVAAHEAPLKFAENAERPPCRFCRHKALCFEAAMPRRNCRTCLHFTFGRDGAGHCMRFDEPRSPQRQQEGKDCPTHLFLPALVPGEQVDADPDAETVTYRLADGTTWIDGASGEAA